MGGAALRFKGEAELKGPIEAIQRFGRATVGSQPNNLCRRNQAREMTHSRVMRASSTPCDGLWQGGVIALGMDSNAGFTIKLQQRSKPCCSQFQLDS